MPKIKTELDSSCDEEDDLFNRNTFSNFPGIKIEYLDDPQNVDSKEGLRDKELIDSKQNIALKSESEPSKKDIASTVYAEIDIEYSDVKEECFKNANSSGIYLIYC